jgi:hypothetical protein
MFDRRGFLANALVATGVAGSRLASRIAANSPNDNPQVHTTSHHVPGAQSGKKVLRAEELVDQSRIKPRGHFFQATVPDTLDLAERARLCINVLTQNMEPTQHYGVYQAFKFGRSPFQLAGLTWNLPGKNARALPLLRTMCGSDFNLDVEYKLMKELLSNVDGEGMIYCPIDSDGAPKNTYYPAFGGILCQAFANWYGRDWNPGWLKELAVVAEGLDRLAIRVPKRAYAYYPTESSIDRDGKWHFTARGKPRIPYTPPEEPVSDQQGLEGSVKWDDGLPLVGLVLNYKWNGNRKSLDVATHIARFLLKPSLWEDTTAQGYAGNEHGIFAGHFHGNTQPLCALLDYAMITNDDWVKQVVREAYDHAIREGVMRMGWFPAWIMPPGGLKYEFNAFSTPDDIPMLLVKLSDAGLGDYWDDLDYILRNHFTEQQFVDLDLMKRISDGGPENEALLRRFWGGYTQGGLTKLTTAIFGGNSEVYSQALYYAWHGITRLDKGVATVNLLLNRVSPWMDINSYIPYEGKVVLHNKTVRTALVRIPSWVRLDEVRSFVGNKVVDVSHTGRFLVFEGLKASDEIRLELPMREREDEYTIHGKKFKVRFRGSTVIDIQPRDTGFRSPHATNITTEYPIYQRERFRSGQAPMKTLTRFVADELIPLN